MELITRRFPLLFQLVRWGGVLRTNSHWVRQHPKLYRLHSTKTLKIKDMLYLFDYITIVYSQCQNYRTEPGGQKYGKIPYLCPPPGSDSERSREI